MSVINMQTMRYINLLDRVSRVKTTKCFVYNNVIIFAVPSSFVSRAIGAGAENIRILQGQLGKRVKIISEPNGIGSKDAEKFVSDIVAPIKFKSAEIRDNVLAISSGGTQNKAGLIGRDKRRLIELEQIVKDVFGLDVRIL